MSNNLIVRASDLSKMMTNSRSKSEVLSQTTKTWLEDKAKQHFYGYHDDIQNKYFEKGNRCEQDVIDLLNVVEFTKHEKNISRVEKDFLSGTCDLDLDNEIIDIKTAFDLSTFPPFTSTVDKIVKASGYDWQIKAYCILYEKPKGKIAYGLVDTPLDLINDWDNQDLHFVSHIEPSKRITYSSDIVLMVEDRTAIRDRYVHANAYYKELINELNNK